MTVPMSAVYNEKNNGPKTEPCGKPSCTPGCRAGRRKLVRGAPVACDSGVPTNRHSWQQTPSTIYGATAGDLKLRQECGIHGIFLRRHTDLAD